MRLVLLRNMEQSGELKIVGEAEYMGLARGKKKDPSEFCGPCNSFCSVFVLEADILLGYKWSLGNFCHLFCYWNKPVIFLI